MSASRTRAREIEQAVRREVERLGLGVEVARGTRHYVAEITGAGRSGHIYWGCTPSCSRSVGNTLSNLRRVVREKGLTEVVGSVGQT